MTRETCKPISMSRNKLDALLTKIDFFLAEVDTSTAKQTVFNDGGMTEQIERISLSLVANISAKNYPWFVGGDVFILALLTGNAVLYKPSEYVAMTGAAIARLLHEAGIPKDVFALLTGEAKVGAGLLAPKNEGLFLYRLLRNGCQDRTNPGSPNGQAGAGRQRPKLCL